LIVEDRREMLLQPGQDTLYPTVSERKKKYFLDGIKLDLRGSDANTMKERRPELFYT
jgi:hypothetical protein